MTHNILLTGGSGYLGGSILASWAKAQISGYNKLFALVRTDFQATSVKDLYGAEPLRCSLQDDEIGSLISDNNITIVVYLINAYDAENAIAFIKALSVLKTATGQDVHLIYTTGTKQFSSLAGAPVDKLLLDTDADLYNIQSKQRTVHKELQDSVAANCNVIDAGEKHNVPVYLLSPCIIYGEGTGFGNKVSIQTVDVVVAAQAAGRVYRVGSEREAWPVCHVSDCVALYTSLLQAILNNNSPGHGKTGYYLASSGRMFWNDIYSSIARALHKRGLIDATTVEPVTEDVLEKMATALHVEPSSVAVKISGESTYTAKHGYLVGWKPAYSPEHILEALDYEVELIVKSLNPKHLGIR